LQSNAWQVDAAVAKVPPLRIEIVKRSDDMKGFVILPRRWVVECTFSWFRRNRRLAKDFENRAETLGAFVALAPIQLVESPGGLCPPGAPRSVREPLDSYGSRCSAVSMTELPVGK
jgi:Transposase DDE domain